LKQRLRPEFLNRLDEIVFFHPLAQAQLESILDLQLGHVNQRLEPQGLQLHTTASAKRLLLETGTDYEYGARPLKRAIQEMLLDPLAEEMLAGKFDGATAIQVDGEDGGITLLPVFEPSPQ